MALLTGGTSAATSLGALLYGRGIGAGGKMTAADVALFNLAVKDDQGNAHSIWPGAMDSGQLSIPNRGILKLLPGDYVMVDATTGWPILLSALAIASGPWAHS